MLRVVEASLRVKGNGTLYTRSGRSLPEQKKVLHYRVVAALNLVILGTSVKD